MPNRAIEPPPARRFAAHTFSSLADADFDIGEYSRVKFGSGRAAKVLGIEMAERFFGLRRDVFARRCVVIPAPSTTVPVAATLLSRHFANRLNALLVAEGASPVEWSLAHRNVTYNTDYAELPKEARRRLLAADCIFLNRDFVCGKFLIFIDDCRITGAHEDRIGIFLKREDIPNDHVFVCYAEYTGGDPSIEARLNHAAIKSGEDLVALASEAGHQVTTRAIRLLLEVSEHRIAALLAVAPPTFVEDAFHAAMTKGYHLHYPATFARLALAATGFRRGGASG